MYLTILTYMAIFAISNIVIPYIHFLIHAPQDYSFRHPNARSHCCVDDIFTQEVSSLAAHRQTIHGNDVGAN
jgi:hypothetical protein